MVERYYWGAIILSSIGILLIILNKYINNTDYADLNRNKIKAAGIGFMIIGLWIFIESFYLS
jgi:hypothetical protein